MERTVFWTKQFVYYFCYNLHEAMGRVDSERKPSLFQFWRKGVEGDKDNAYFIPLSAECQGRLSELMICDLCPEGKFHVYHRRRWSQTRSLEWDEGQTLYFIVDQGPIKEFWKWIYQPEESLIGLISLTIETPPFELSVGEVISERQPAQLFQTVTPKGPIDRQIKLVLATSHEEPGDKYWEDFFQKPTQETILTRLLEGFS